MREFYLYGFKTRGEYSAKSARSYDDERRRIESWLGDYMRFSKTAEGKTVFLSVDSRVTKSNPFYKAWKARSFTDGDITLHFILFDILCSKEISLTLPEILERIDEYLFSFDEPMSFDESTVRKKLKEYTEEGIIKMNKVGRRVTYSRADETDITTLSEALDFFSEVAPCGVVGSFLLDKLEPHTGLFGFKHHYITGAVDSGILASLFHAMRRRCFITADSFGRHDRSPRTVKILPLKIYISAQNGRQNLIAYNEELNRLNTYRLDYLSNIKFEEVCLHFDSLRAELVRAEAHMWGVNCKWYGAQTECVEFDIRITDEERYVVKRLERECRCGKVIKLDENNYRFTAEVYDTFEMIPWIRSFTAYITRMNFSDRIAENRMKKDLESMYDLYGIEVNQ